MIDKIIDGLLDKIFFIFEMRDKTLNWLFENKVAFFLCTALIFGVSIYYIDTHTTDEFKSSFLGGILVEAHGMLMDIIVFGIVLTLYEKITENRNEIKRLEEEIDDYRGWNEPEAMYRIVGCIKRLNRKGVTNINLQNCFLENANLQRVNLEKANLENVILCGADLEKARIVEANLWKANLKEANLKEVDLSYTDLTMANLTNANLTNTILYDSILWGTILNGTDFFTAKLQKAKLSGAILDGVKLRGDVICRTDLRGGIISELGMIDEIEDCTGIRYMLRPADRRFFLGNKYYELYT